MEHSVKSGIEEVDTFINNPDIPIETKQAVISLKFASILFGTSPFTNLCPTHALDVVLPEEEKIKVPD